MECDHESVRVKLEDALNEEEDRLTIPLECEDCGEVRSDEVIIAWLPDMKVTSIEELDSCPHDTILFDFEGFEVTYHGGFDVSILVLGECDDCRAMFYDEVDIDLS